MPRKPSGRRRPPRAEEESFSAEALQAAIDRSGQSWRAAVTPLSQLPPAEQKARLGLVVDEAELAATAQAIQAASALVAFRAIAAPAAIDWRNNNGNWITPVRDQLS